MTGGAGFIGSHLVDRSKRGEEPIIHGDGEQARDFVFVGDVVDACLRAMKCKNCVGDVINVGAGVEVSVNRIASVLTELGYKPEFSLREGLAMLFRELGMGRP